MHQAHQALVLIYKDFVKKQTNRQTGVNWGFTWIIGVLVSVWDQSGVCETESKYYAHGCCNERKWTPNLNVWLIHIFFLLFWLTVEETSSIIVG